MLTGESTNHDRPLPQALPDVRGFGLPGFATLGILLCAYVFLRALAWSNTVLLEDHDSILYVQQIQAYLSFDPALIFALSPDSTPFYPFFGSLMSLPGWSAEFGARLCSLVFSIILFVAAAGILRRITSPAGAALSLLALSLSPYLITFSISILSEPTYVAVAYAGLWYYLARHNSPSLWHALGLGVVFGLTFLNRLEGMVFLVLLPMLQAAYLFSRHGSFKAATPPLVRWSLVYAAGFVIVAAPQVLVVSEKMDRFALNGREVWAQLLLSSDGGSYEEQIYGLDYSAEEINLTYFQTHSGELAQDAPRTSVIHLAETLLRNIDKFYAVQVGKLGGSLLVALFFCGLLQLWQSRLFFPLLVVIAFTGAFLLPGLATDPKPRAVASVVPLLLILAGPGVLFATRQVSAIRGGPATERGVPAALMMLLVLVWLVPLLGIYLKERTANFEYSLTDLAPLVGVVDELSLQMPDRTVTINGEETVPVLSERRTVRAAAFYRPGGPTAVLSQQRG